MNTILIADDDKELAESLSDLLRAEGFAVELAKPCDDLVLALSPDTGNPPDLLLMDLNMPEKPGMDVLRELRQRRHPPLPVIVITGTATATEAIEAIQLGAYDYIKKPFDLDDVFITIKRYFDWQRLSDDVTTLAAQLGRRDPDETLVGDSAPMQEIYKTIGRVSRSDATVLITGETGTGKELVATIIHQTSPFARGPLVKVNCAALPESLLESELFGHEKGAFTGAIAQRKGRFEMANKGSIFLDEIGEMTLATQRKLLRVLQEREFERVGGTVTVKVDTRVIAATNRDLSLEVAEGRFREDLYYRLNVINIELPPLRERKDDIPDLVEHLLNKHRYTPKSPASRISQSALDMLMEYDWPGNVRELENVIQRAVIFSAGGVIGEEHLNFHSPTGFAINIQRRLRENCSLQEILDEVERKTLREAIDMSGGDLEAAAEMLKITLRKLKTMLAQHENGS